MSWFTCFFLIVAGALKGVNHAIAFHGFGQGNKFWDMSLAWTNKWKDGIKDHGEAFWGSSRWFVAATDGFHLTQLFMHIFLILAVVCYRERFEEGHKILKAMDFVLFYFLYTTAFALVFDKL